MHHSFQSLVILKLEISSLNQIKRSCFASAPIEIPSDLSVEKKRLIEMASQ
jgi:hypothetical protein